MIVRPLQRLLGAAFLAVLATSAMAAPDDLATARPVIERANAEWLGAMKAKNAEALAAPYAEDGVFVLANGQELVGRAAIVDFYRGRMTGLAQVLDGGIHHEGMALARDGLIYEWGHGGATTVDTAGHRSASDGPYLTVWKRQSDGGWAIVRNLVF